MKLLITGSNGLLGQKLVKLCIRYGYDFIACSRGENRNPDCPSDRYVELDIANKLAVNHLFQSWYPSHVIHTAAITNVDYCELHPEECRRINVEGSKNLFDASMRYQAHFQLLSTDFVFDGEDGPYDEDAPVNPLSTYARSKAESEQLLINSDYSNWSIVRTIIVIGTASGLSRSNMVLWVKKSLEQGEHIRVVNDQFRMPTWADDLAWGCLQICSLSERGIFHLSGKDFVSMLEFAYQIADYYQLDRSLISPVRSEELKQAAKRPPKTGFILDKAITRLGYRPKSIAEFLELMPE
ncbi:MAG: SDR family oxidoreductase [Bacteroidetes bacterium]|nr:MAG: SDR family oxidoreductase [Bacteroidota bacterium]